MSGNGRCELGEARWVLIHVSDVITGARWELSRMRLDVLDAHLRLGRLTSPRRAAGHGTASTDRGILLRGVVVSCEEGAAAGAAVDRQLREAIAGLKAAAVLVTGVRPVGTHQELAQVRLERELADLRTQLEAGRPPLSTSATALREVADRARKDLPALAGTNAVVGSAQKVERMHGMVLRAAEQCRSGDQELDRAQARTGQLITQIGTLARDTGLKIRARRHDVGPRAPSNGMPR